MRYCFLDVLVAIAVAVAKTLYWRGQGLGTR